MQITHLPVDGYERVVKATDPESGLRAFICVHSTALGPSLGGLRMWNYESEEAALTDVKRLAEGMTYKSAVARTGLGGGKAVIMGASREIKSKALYLAMGRFIDSLEGAYITAEDVNTTVDDLETVRQTTKFVTGYSKEHGGSDNPSPFTAYGVFLGIKAALKWKTGSDDLAGRKVAVQGVGSVGGSLVKRLAKAGAKCFIADRRAERVEALEAEVGAVPVAAEEIVGLDVDVLAPCALGGIIDDVSLPRLRCEVVAGAANNQLLERRHGQALHERGILYAPDYVINAGGIIQIAVCLRANKYDEENSVAKIERIPEALREIWTIEREQDIPSSDAALQLAKSILAEARPARTPRATAAREPATAPASEPRRHLRR